MNLIDIFHLFTLEDLRSIPASKTTFQHVGSELQELKITDDMVYGYQIMLHSFITIS